MKVFLFCSKKLVDWLPPSTGKVKSRWCLHLRDFSLYSIMATVYIIYSTSINQFYIGSCLDLQQRLKQHLNKSYLVGFTHRADDWELFYSTVNLEYETARKIETHIKKMKSRKYLENLKLYPEIMEKLIEKYRAGSSR